MPSTYATLVDNGLDETSSLENPKLGMKVLSMSPSLHYAGLCRELLALTIL